MSNIKKTKTKKQHTIDDIIIKHIMNIIAQHLTKNKNNTKISLILDIYDFVRFARTT